MGRPTDPASTTSSVVDRFFRNPDFQLRDFGASVPAASLSRYAPSSNDRQPVMVVVAGVTTAASAVAAGETAGVASTVAGNDAGTSAGCGAGGSTADVAAGFASGAGDGVFGVAGSAT